MSSRAAGVWLGVTIAVGGVGCARSDAAESAPSYDPLALARIADTVANPEAGVPPMCYTRTDGASNPCWVCHTTSVGRNTLNDADLQEAYGFSDAARENHWRNLFVDRRPFLASVGDDEILGWVRQDNYDPLRRALARVPAAGYAGFRPDLDLDRGFDELGFARDGSGWRAVRYQPFPGAFWPTNGSADDLYVRLPDEFRRAADGTASRAVYQVNLAILEAAIAGAASGQATGVDRTVELVDERVAALDLNGDGQLGLATVIAALPPHYAGAAAAIAVEPLVYPRGTELLHSVRYLDPDAPGMVARRMKELRYARKVEAHDAWSTLRAYEREHDEKDEGRAPRYRGSPETGLLNAFGWQLQGFIEDEHGALRLQTEEEHRACMGCHAGVGVTVDSTFSFPRKVPGAGGWRRHDLHGLQDRPQVGHADPELLTYLRRVGGGDETRSNEELLARYFPGGQLDEAAVRGAADLHELLTPSRARALALDKAYLAIVREQSFTRGRDATIAPATRVHPRIDAESTGLGEAGRVHRDGRLHLQWE